MPLTEIDGRLVEVEPAEHADVVEKMEPEPAINKSALVREFLAKYPLAGPAEIQRRLDVEANVSVTQALVSKVKGKRPGDSFGNVTAKANDNSKYSLDELLAVDKFVKAVGGTGRAAELLRVYTQIT